MTLRRVPRTRRRAPERRDAGAPPVWGTPFAPVSGRFQDCTVRHRWDLPRGPVHGVSRTWGVPDCAGISIRLADLSRSRARSGSLERLVQELSPKEVTPNPTVFVTVPSDGADHEGQLPEPGRGPCRGGDHPAQCATGARDACDEFTESHGDCKGCDLRVHRGVPTLASDATGAIEEAARLHELVGREHVLIRIPDTGAGLGTIGCTIAADISVNVTTVFPVRRHVQVMEACARRPERDPDRGRDLSVIHSAGSVLTVQVDRGTGGRPGPLGRPDLRGRGEGPTH